MAALYQKYLGGRAALPALQHSRWNGESAGGSRNVGSACWAVCSKNAEVTERCGIREGFEIVGNRDRISSEGDGD